MPNKNYVKGRRKEYRIVHDYRDKRGFEIAQRTAGSHSPFDVVAIDKNTQTIVLIQAKPDKFSEKEEKKIMDEWGWLNGEFKVEFEVI